MHLPQLCLGHTQATEAHFQLWTKGLCLQPLPFPPPLASSQLTQENGFREPGTRSLGGGVHAASISHPPKYLLGSPA